MQPQEKMVQQMIRIYLSCSEKCSKVLSSVSHHKVVQEYFPSAFKCLHDESIRKLEHEEDDGTLKHNMTLEKCTLGYKKTGLSHHLSHSDVKLLTNSDLPISIFKLSL